MDRRDSRDTWWRSRSLLPISFVVASGLIAASMVITAAVRSDPLSELELLLFQVLVLGLGLTGSFVFGKQAGAAPPNLQSAFRRVLRLYQALGRIVSTIQERQRVLAERSSSDGLVSAGDVLDSLSMIELQVQENLATADDAMEDWRDLAPLEVEAIERKASERAESLGGDDFGG